MNYPNLRPKTDNFRRLGPLQLLICLFGSLPCGIHNIPIEVWIPKKYPREAPIIFITPSIGVTIRATGMVDVGGRVLHPVFAAWKSDSVGLLEVLRVIGEALAMDPPFYPGAGRPVYPSSNIPMMMSQPIGSPESMGGSVIPNRLTIMPTQYGQFRSQPPPPPYHQPQAQYGQSQYHHQSPQSSTQVYSLPPSHQSYFRPSTDVQTDSLIELRRAMKERMNIRFQKLQHELALESDRLLAENTQLEQGGLMLKSGLEKLQEEVKKIEFEIESIRSKKEMAMKLVQNDGEIDCDSFIRPCGPIAKQIMDVHVEDLALEDLVYALSKAFFEGKTNVPLNLYLRHVRELAREHFLAKALLTKIRNEFPQIQ